MLVSIEPTAGLSKRISDWQFPRGWSLCVSLLDTAIRLDIVRFLEPSAWLRFDIKIFLILFEQGFPLLGTFLAQLQLLPSFTQGRQKCENHRTTNESTHHAPCAGQKKLTLGGLLLEPRDFHRLRGVLFFCSYCCFFILKKKMWIWNEHLKIK